MATFLFFNFFFLLLFFRLFIFVKEFRPLLSTFHQIHLFFSIVQKLHNTIHVDTISTMFYYDTFILFTTISKFQKLVEYTFELNFEMNSNEFCMVPTHSRVLWMYNSTKVTLDMHKSPIILYNNLYIFNTKFSNSCKFEKNLIMHASCPSKFIILKHTFYVNNILQQSWMKRLLTIIIFLANYWNQNWNMQPINYTYNMKIFMKSFKFICQNLKLTLTWKLNK